MRHKEAAKGYLQWKQMNRKCGRPNTTLKMVRMKENENELMTVMQDRENWKTQFIHDTNFVGWLSK